VSNTWTIGNQSFSTRSRHFTWSGHGLFAIRPPSAGKSTFSYTVSDTTCPTSPVTVVTVLATAHPKPSAKGPVITYGGAPPSEGTPIYIAMGDAYSAGEGNPPFETGTHSSADSCHRSVRAYGPTEWTQNIRPHDSAMHFLFTACSGDVGQNIGFEQSDGTYTGTARFGAVASIDNSIQDTQLLRYQVDPKHYVALISATIGASDAHLGPILTHCAKQEVDGSTPVQSCDSYARSHVNVDATAKTLLKVYQGMLNAAPYAQIFILGYPKLFATDHHSLHCAIPRGSRAPLDDLIDRFDKKLKQTVESSSLRHATAQGGGRRIHYVDVENAFVGHNLCRSPGGASDLTGLKALTGPRAVYSFSPNSRGQSALEGALNAAMKSYY
jgi:hypothetical protein